MPVVNHFGETHHFPYSKPVEIELMVQAQPTPRCDAMTCVRKFANGAANKFYISTKSIEPTGDADTFRLLLKVPETENLRAEERLAAVMEVAEDVYGVRLLGEPQRLTALHVDWSQQLTGKLPMAG